MADAQHLPNGRRQAGDRHLKIHDSRDNLVHGYGGVRDVTLECSAAVADLAGPDVDPLPGGRVD